MAHSSQDKLGRAHLHTSYKWRIRSRGTIRDNVESQAYGSHYHPQTPSSQYLERKKLQEPRSKEKYVELEEAQNDLTEETKGIITPTHCSDSLLAKLKLKQEGWKPAVGSTQVNILQLRKEM